METKTNLGELKRTTKHNIKTINGITKTVSHIGVVAVKDDAKRDFLVQGLSAIGLGAVVLAEAPTESIENISFAAKLNPNELPAFDFFIYDNDHSGIDVGKCMKAGIVPIMPEQNVFSGILKEFNPMKFEGNGFFWKKDNAYCMFEKVISYLENIKFPEDRRVLLKNVTETF
jgi:hypothetical protein